MNISWVALFLSCTVLSLSAAEKLNLKLPETEMTRKEYFTQHWREGQVTIKEDTGLKWQQKSQNFEEKEKRKKEEEEAEMMFNYRQSYKNRPYYRQHVTNPHFDSFDKDSYDTYNFRFRSKKKH